MAKKTTNRLKTTASPKTHPHVVSFRVTDEQFHMMEEILKRQPITHVKSPNQLGRKVVVDFLAARLAYKVKEDALRDLEPIGK